MRQQPITISEPDAQRLRHLLRSPSAVSRDEEHLQGLAAELERAYVLDATEVPTDVVTMGSQVRVFDLTSGLRRDYVLVFPADADLATHRISVLAPLGTALLGFKEGDEVEWLMPGELRRLRIERVMQPVQIGALEHPLAGRHSTGSLVA